MIKAAAVDAATFHVGLRAVFKGVFDRVGVHVLVDEVAAIVAAAERLGFSFEGIFRQAVVYKGRSRDTAWYSVIDSEWPAVRRGFEHWLHPDNLTADGTPRESLAQCRALDRRLASGGADPA